MLRLNRPQSLIASSTMNICIYYIELLEVYDGRQIGCQHSVLRRQKCRTENIQVIFSAISNAGGNIFGDFSVRYLMHVATYIYLVIFRYDSNAGDNRYLSGYLIMTMSNVVSTGIHLASMLAIYYLLLAYGWVIS